MDGVDDPNAPVIVPVGETEPPMPALIERDQFCAVALLFNAM